MSSPKQPDSSKVKPLPKAYYFSNWSLGLSIKSSVENILPNKVYSEDFEFNYQPKFSYEVELFIERKLDNRWDLVGGINFHSVSFEYDHIFSITFSKTSDYLVDGNYINQYDLTIDNSFEQMNFIATTEYTMFEDGNDYQDNEALNFRVSSVNTIKYLGVPLAIKKEFGTLKLRFSAKGGIEPAIIIKNNIDYERYHQSGYFIESDRANYKSNKIGSPEIPRAEIINLERISQTNNLKNFQLNGFLNIGLLHTYRYHTFFLETEYKRGFISFSQEGSPNRFLNNYGFKTGFIKRFEESKVIDMARPKRFFSW